MKYKFKAGIFKQQYQYKSFQPFSINEEFEWSDKRINVLLEEAIQELAELNAYSTLVPDIDFFISMYITKEARNSSLIEGTHTEMDELILPEDEIVPEKKDNIREVHNYIEAINHAIKKLDDLPLSMRLLNETHAILLKEARGREKLPGEIRKSQNWIGGSSLKDAMFIPPHPEDLPVLITNLEKFWHNDNLELPNLIKIAIGHYQFETIHPYCDGNGRIGRLLITLQLIDKNMLKKPTLYLSEFFEKNKGAYYDSLTMVRTSNDLEQWIRFFLVGIAETSKKGKKTLQNILELKNNCEDKIMTLGKKSKKAKALLEILYACPAVNSGIICNLLKITPRTANTLIKDFEELGILINLTKSTRNRIFVFQEYLYLFK